MSGCEGMQIVREGCQRQATAARGLSIFPDSSSSSAPWMPQGGPSTLAHQLLGLTM